MWLGRYDETGALADAGLFLRATGFGLRPAARDLD